MKKFYRICANIFCTVCRECGVFVMTVHLFLGVRLYAWGPVVAGLFTRLLIGWISIPEVKAWELCGTCNCCPTYIIYNVASDATSSGRVVRIDPGGAEVSGETPVSEDSAIGGSKVQVDQPKSRVEPTANNPPKIIVDCGGQSSKGIIKSEGGSRLERRPQSAGVIIDRGSLERRPPIGISIDRERREVEVSRRVRSERTITYRQAISQVISNIFNPINRNSLTPVEDASEGASFSNIKSVETHPIKK